MFAGSRVGSIYEIADSGGYDDDKGGSCPMFKHVE
jgi:hypothetical protein